MIIEIVKREEYLYLNLVAQSDEDLLHVHTGDKSTLYLHGDTSMVEHYADAILKGKLGEMLFAIKEAVAIAYGK